LNFEESSSNGSAQGVKKTEVTIALLSFKLLPHSW